MTRISLCLVIIVGILGLVGCSQVPVATKMVPSAFSMYKRDLPRSISIGKVYGCDPSLKSNKYKITDPVFKQALGDALNNSKLFQKAVYDDLGSNYVLEAELALVAIPWSYLSAIAFMIRSMASSCGLKTSILIAIRAAQKQKPSRPDVPISSG